MRDRNSQRGRASTRAWMARYPRRQRARTIPEEGSSKAEWARTSCSRIRSGDLSGERTDERPPRGGDGTSDRGDNSWRGGSLSESQKCTLAGAGSPGEPEPPIETDPAPLKDERTSRRRGHERVRMAKPPPPRHRRSSARHSSQTSPLRPSSAWPSPFPRWRGGHSDR